MIETVLIVMLISGLIGALLSLRQTARPGLPLWLLAIGVGLMVGSAVINSRLIWEQTGLTWECGIQSVGYSLIHASPLAALLLFPYVLALWVAVSVAYVLWRLWRGSPFSWVSLIAIGLSVAILVAGALPYKFWLNFSVDRLASSPHAGEFFVIAASDGDLVTIKKFLARGISVDIRYRYNGKTGLHAAASAGELEVIKSLIAAGADVNAIDREGNSPLGLATGESAKYLADHGANMVRGTEEQRQKFIREAVLEDIQRMDKDTSGECWTYGPWAPFDAVTRDKPRCACGV